MFTGIITALGRVRGVVPIGAGSDMRVIVETPWQDAAAIPIGASIACSGCCLTAVGVGAPRHVGRYGELRLGDQLHAQRGGLGHG